MLVRFMLWMVGFITTVAGGANYILGKDEDKESLISLETSRNVLLLRICLVRQSRTKSNNCYDV